MGGGNELAKQQTDGRYRREKNHLGSRLGFAELKLLSIEKDQLSYVIDLVHISRIQKDSFFPMQ